MSEKTLKFNNIRLNKKEFHKSKQPIDLNLINADQLVVSDKFKHSDHGFKYFIGYKKGKMTGYIKYFEKGGKTRLSWLQIRVCWINTIKFGTRLRISLVYNFIASLFMIENT